MAGGRKALVVATYEYRDAGLRRLAAPEHDAESFAAVLEDPAVAGFDVTMLVNEPHHVVGEAIADFYAGCRRDDLALLYFSGHGLKDDEGRLHLAMTNTRREALLFTAISAAQLNDAMDASASRRKVLVLDCCYSGAFPAGRSAKADEGVHTLERFQGKGRAVLTASDATQYAFEGDDLSGSGTSSVFTRYLVEAIRSGAADLDEDGDIALDELYSYVRERVVAEMPQQRPKKQEDVDGRILIARNVHWTLPAHLRHAIDSPIAAQRLSAVDGLGHLHRVGNGVVRATVAEHLTALAADDSRSVSAAATALLESLGSASAVGAATVEDAPVVVDPSPPEARLPEQPPRKPEPRIARPQEGRTSDASPREPRPPAPPRQEAHSPEEAGSVADPGVPVLALVLAAGVLLFLSRLFAFDSDNGYYAPDVGYATLPWVVCVVLPLLAAAQLVLLRRSSDWTVGPVVGLIGGVTLIQVEQVIATTTLAADPDAGVNAGGPGWWLAVLGTAVLVACLFVVARGRSLLEEGIGGGTWRTLLGVVLVVGALFVWLSAFGDFYLWWPANIAGLLMAGVAVPIVVLPLNGSRRMAALVAVTVFGVWIVVSIVHALLVQSYWADTGDGLTVAGSAMLSVLGCYVAQLRISRRSENASAGRQAR